MELKQLKDKLYYKMPVARWIYYAKRFSWEYIDPDLVIDVLKSFLTTHETICMKDFRMPIYNAWKTEQSNFKREDYESEGNLELFEKLIKDQHGLDVNIALLIFHHNRRQISAEIMRFNECVIIFEKNHHLVDAIRSFSGEPKYGYED